MILKRETSLNTNQPDEAERARKRLDYIERKGRPVRDREPEPEPQLEPQLEAEQVRERGLER